jgi:hypothetical protein
MDQVKTRFNISSRVLKKDDGWRKTKMLGRGITLNRIYSGTTETELCAVYNFGDWCCCQVKNKVLGPLATITLRVVPFRAYAWFPALPTFFKSIPEVTFYEDAQGCLQLCLNNVICVKMAVSSTRKQRKVSRGQVR